MSQIKLFLENKSHENPKACVRRHVYAYVCSKPGMQTSWMHMHAKVLETMKGKFSALKLRFGMNLTSSGSRSKPPFSQYKKPYMEPFKDTQKILRKNLRFTRNSELKREFFTKNPQDNFLLIKTFSGLDLWFLKFTNQFCLVVNRFDLGERSKSSKRAFVFEV